MRLEKLRLPLPHFFPITSLGPQTGWFAVSLLSRCWKPDVHGQEPGRQRAVLALRAAGGPSRLFQLLMLAGSPGLVAASLRSLSPSSCVLCVCDFLLQGHQ